jgi:hypothetical protein
MRNIAGGTETNNKHLNQYSQSAARDSNPISPENDAEALSDIK